MNVERPVAPSVFLVGFRQQLERAAAGNISPIGTWQTVQGFMREIVLAAFLSFVSFCAAASCTQHAFTDPSRVPAGDTLMIVTHPTAKYDPRLASKRGVEEALRFARARRIPVVYLADRGNAAASQYFIDDCSPDSWVYSEDGEIAFDVRATHLYVVGGHLEVCLSNTLLDVLQKWAKQPGADRTVTYFMDAIYSNGKDIGESDPYYRNYVTFMSAVTYGKPHEEQWAKLTLLETMGLIANPARQREYLQRTLPFYQKLLPGDYRVEIRVNGTPERVLQSGRGARPPVLKFQFVDSALAMTAPLQAATQRE